MAAIIAQLTRAKREREKKKTFENSKCLYTLDPFDSHFDPQKHNRYIIRRAELADRAEATAALESLVREILAASRPPAPQFTYRRAAAEGVVIVLLLAIVPTALVLVELAFARMEEAAAGSAR